MHLEPELLGQRGDVGPQRLDGRGRVVGLAGMNDERQTLVLDPDAGRGLDQRRQPVAQLRHLRRLVHRVEPAVVPALRAVDAFHVQAGQVGQAAQLDHRGRVPSGDHGHPSAHGGERVQGGADAVDQTRP